MLRTTVGMLAICLLQCTLVVPPADLAAQSPVAGGSSEKGKPRKPKAAKEPPARLPRYFTRLGLADMQRDQILEIQARYADEIAEQQLQIDRAKDQIQELRSQRDKDFSGALTASQRRKLKELTQAQKTGKKTRKKAS